MNDDFKRLLRFQIKRAREYYNKAETGIRMIKQTKSRLAILAIKEIYSKILDNIEKMIIIYFRNAHMLIRSAKLPQY